MMKEVLKLENITKNFDTADGKLEILKDINLSVYSSQSVSIVGRSGSGKSTLLSIAALIDKPSSGSKKRTATPVITVKNTNDLNAWYNGLEADKDGNVTVEVATTTKNATITVKVNGKKEILHNFEILGKSA